MESLKALAIFLVVILIIVVGPVAVIWAWNTLFPMVAVPLTFWTWLAVVILGGFIRAKVTTAKS